eukprot:TRINITY_DN3429_c0_g1_i1.p1 TRINITY_DN3429_c0_g1~~TRINITY_DN3429_c0_g1_i1.p1  ORF type:complete len:700 (+),score=282.04 TRINITY_DN3429_c0_g1_i1:118-2217(+)
MEQSYQQYVGYEQEIYPQSMAAQYLQQQQQQQLQLQQQAGFPFNGQMNMNMNMGYQESYSNMQFLGMDQSSICPSPNQFNDNYMTFLSDDHEDIESMIASNSVKLEQHSPDHVTGRGFSSPIANSDSDSDLNIFTPPNQSSMSSTSTSPSLAPDSFPGSNHLLRYQGSQYMNQQFAAQAVKDEQQKSSSSSSSSSSNSSGSNANNSSSSNDNSSCDEDSEDKVHFVSVNPSSAKKKNFKKKFSGDDLKNCPTTCLTLPREKLLSLSSKQLEEYAASISAIRPLTEDELRDLKRQRRLIKNRESAQASRSRRKCQLFELSNQINSLKQERRELKNRVEFLETENRRLKHELQNSNFPMQHAQMPQVQILPQQQQQSLQAIPRGNPQGFAGFANSVWETFSFDRQNQSANGAAGNVVNQRPQQVAGQNANYSVSTTGICLLIVMFTFGMFFQNSIDGIGASAPALGRVAPLIFPSISYPVLNDAIQMDKRVIIEEMPPLASQSNRKLLEYDDNPTKVASVHQIAASENTKQPIAIIESTIRSDISPDDAKIEMIVDDQEISQVSHMPNKKRLFSESAFSFESDESPSYPAADHNPAKKAKAQPISGPIMGNITIPSAEKDGAPSNIEFILSPLNASASGKQEEAAMASGQNASSPLLLAMVVPSNLAEQLAANISMLSSHSDINEAPARSFPYSVLSQPIV